MNFLAMDTENISSWMHVLVLLKLKMDHFFSCCYWEPCVHSILLSALTQVNKLEKVPFILHFIEEFDRLFYTLLLYVFKFFDKLVIKRDFLKINNLYSLFFQLPKCSDYPKTPIFFCPLKNKSAKKFIFKKLPNNKPNVFCL